MKYTVLVHPAEEGGFWSEVPALPGCFYQGETVEETLRNTTEAIAAHITCLKEDGCEIKVDDVLLIAQVSVAA